MRTLLLANTSYAGMGPYIVSIVNSFDKNDDVFFFLVEDQEGFYKKNLKESLLDKCLIVKRNTSKFHTLYNLLFDSRYPYHIEVKNKIKEWNIDCVHSLTSLTDYKLTKWLSKNVKLIYTIHDLVPHEAKKAFYKEWRQNTGYKRVFKSIEYCKNLVTNSKSQLAGIKEKYPDKNAFFFNFPTLITDDIASGKMQVEELKNESDYILFFGRIEHYKGVDLLIEAYNSNKDLQNKKLVIAGKGELSSSLDNPNIIRINRFIDDREIADLYKKASLVVYPYISASQSGVLSVASYFGKPMLLSDVPFFKETIGEAPFAEFFQNGNVNDLADKLGNCLAKETSKIEQDEETQFYMDCYSSDSLKSNLFKIYNQL